MMPRTDEEWERHFQELEKLVGFPVDRNNPIARVAGIWADDPTFDEYVAEIQRYRQEKDAREREWELKTRPQDANTSAVSS